MVDEHDARRNMPHLVQVLMHSFNATAEKLPRKQRLTLPNQHFAELLCTAGHMLDISGPAQNATTAQLGAARSFTQIKLSEGYSMPVLGETERIYMNL